MTANIDQLKSMNSVFTYLVTIDEAIITKLDRNIKQVKFYTNMRDKGGVV